MITETPRVPEGGAWMGAFYILPCKDASEHRKQDDRLLYAAKGENVAVSYCNALFCGVYPCFISEAVDVDTTCFQAAWPDASFDAMQTTGELINRFLLAYHRRMLTAPFTKRMLGLIGFIKVAVLRKYPVERLIEARDVHLHHTPILNWLPAPGGTEALATLTTLFPPEQLDGPEGYLD